MAAVDQLPSTRRVILDASAIRALVRGDHEARAALSRAARQGFAVVIPAPVLAQVHGSGQDRMSIDAVVDAVRAVVPTTERVGRLAGQLQARTQTSDTVEAIVGAEAMIAAPAVIVSHDGGRAADGHSHLRTVVVRR